MSRVLALVLLLLCTSARAVSAPASEASIRELLALTDARKLVEGVFSQVDTLMQSSMMQRLGRPLTADEQHMADTLSKKMMAMMREELAWEKLEPRYLEIYQKSFTQEEIEGIIAFYKTPAGQALIKKMPLVLQQTMTTMQSLMNPLMRKIQAAAQEAAAELKAEREIK